MPHPVLDVAPSATDRVRPGLDRVVFGVTAALAIAFLIWGFVSTDSLANVSADSLGWTIDNAGWLFVITASGFVVFVLWLALSQFGGITLGRDDEEPEFRTTSWIAMMFSAGMGIGLMFWGVSEPIAHLTTPPPGTEGGTEAEAMKTALSTTLFHWTLHPWAIYAVVGLAIAYGVYRKGRVQLISAAFEPLLGRHAHGPAGKVIDMLAIFATLFGSAASLGLGALQIGSGLEIVAGLGEVGNGLLVMVIAVLTVGFVASAVSGVARGIQWLSNINMVLALVLALFVFLVGPTIFVLNLLPTAIGGYVADLPTMAARTGAEGGDTNDWLQGWTVFYWAWWLSWTPFVGMFIARISRGRTIRQFVSGVLLVPSLVSLVWFCIFGGAALDLQSSGAADIAGAASTESRLFTMLEAYPAATATSILVMVLVGIFFISGADAASIVMGTLSERGTTTAAARHGGVLGCGHRRCRRGDAPGRRVRGAQRSAVDHDRRRAAVRARDDRARGRAGEGPARRSGRAAPGLRPRGRRAGGDRRRDRARRRLRALHRVHRRRRHRRHRCPGRRGRRAGERHHDVDRGRPSLNPAADCTPTIAWACSSARLRAPA